jgi:hypothetical protein
LLEYVFSIYLGSLFINKVLVSRRALYFKELELTLQ